MPYKRHDRKPTALTPEVQEKIVQAMARGSFMEPACRAAGLTRQAVDYWRKKVEAGDPDAEIYVDFFARLAGAQHQAEIDAVSMVLGGGWQGAAWWLARRYPKRWSEKMRAAAAQPTLDPTAPSDEDGNQP